MKIASKVDLCTNTCDGIPKVIAAETTAGPKLDCTTIEYCNRYGDDSTLPRN